MNNDPVRSRRVKKGAGPVYTYEMGFINEKKNKNGKYSINNTKTPCGDGIDNIVSYTYTIGDRGNHLSYVECGYVE